jgi:hypothetical protein
MPSAGPRLRMPGPELPELRAATIEGERLLIGKLRSGRWREDEEIMALVRRLGTARTRVGVAGRMAARRARPHPA